MPLGWHLDLLPTWGFKKTENISDKDFPSLYQWFIDKLSIHFEEDKTKPIFFSKAKDLKETYISLANYFLQTSFNPSV